MKIKNINGIRVITPETGNCLCERRSHIVSDEIWLGKHDSPSNWEEISIDEAHKLELFWIKEAESNV